MSKEIIHVKSFIHYEVYVDGTFHKVLTENLAKIDIRNNIDNGYPVIQLFFHSDNQVFIQDNIYPQKKLVINIWYTDENGEVIPDPVIFDLVVLQHDLQLPSKRFNNVSKNEDTQKRISCATCVCRTAFKIMSACVNRLWETEITPYDAVCTLMDDVNITNRLVKCKGKNEDTIDQLIIPPMSFNEALSFINNMYGVYNNEMFRYCDWNGTFKMWDMKEYFDENKGCGNIKLHKLPIFGPPELTDPATEIAQKSSKDYLSYDNVSTTNRIVDSFIENGFNQTYIYHPAFDIAYYVNKQMAQEFINHGNIHGCDCLKYDSDALSERYKVHADDHGMMKEFYGSKPSECLINRRFSRESLKLNFVKFNITRKLKIHDLMKVGSLVYFKPYSEHEKFDKSSYEGSYMIFDSHIILDRFKNGALSDIVTPNAVIVAARTNQSFT